MGLIANFVFEIRAPTAELATRIAEEALEAFSRTHPKAVQSVGTPKWHGDQCLSIRVILDCRSREDAVVLRGVLRQLIHKQERLAGVEPKPTKWWQFWK